MEKRFTKVNDCHIVEGKKEWNYKEFEVWEKSKILKIIKIARSVKEYLRQKSGEVFTFVVFCAFKYCGVFPALR